MCCWFDCENTFSTRNGINETGPCLAVYSIHHIRVCYMYACMAWYRVWLSNPQTNYYVTQQSEHDNSYSTPTLWALHYQAKFSYCFMLIRPLFLCINRWMILQLGWWKKRSLSIWYGMVWWCILHTGKKITDKFHHNFTRWQFAAMAYAKNSI